MYSGPRAARIWPYRLLPLTLFSLCHESAFSSCLHVSVRRKECVCCAIPREGVDYSDGGDVRRQLSPITYLHLLEDWVKMKHILPPPLHPPRPALSCYGVIGLTQVLSVAPNGDLMRFLHPVGRWGQRHTLFLLSVACRSKAMDVSAFLYFTFVCQPSG